MAGNRMLPCNLDSAIKAQKRIWPISSRLDLTLGQLAIQHTRFVLSFLCPGLDVSVILRDLDYSKYLGKLLSFLDPVLSSSERGRFVRCWHAKTDGSAASTFHNNCDGKGPTVTIIKYGSYIFGAYTDVSWNGKYH